MQKTAPGSLWVLFTDDGNQQKVVAQLRGNVEILVAQTQREKPMAHQFHNGMLHAVGLAFILEAGGQNAADTQTLVKLSQEQCASVAAEEPSGEMSDNSAGTGVLKKHGGNQTLCVEGTGIVCILFETSCLQKNSRNYSLGFFLAGLMDGGKH